MPIQPAKLTRPQAKSVLPRERVFALLDDISSRRGVWVGAPAGTGKTSLASSWVQARGHACIWYNLDSGDADPATIFHYLAIVAKAKAGRRRIQMSALTPEFLPGLDVFARRFFEQLFALYPSRFVLVFDNCHELSAESHFYRPILQAIVGALPENGQLLCLSRSATPALPARLVSSAELHVLGRADLCFTDSEATEYAKRSHESGVALAIEFNRLARGWVTGLKLLLRSFPTGPAQAPSKAMGPQALFDYLAEEVYEQLTPAAQEFLLKCAVLPEMNGQITQALTGRDDAERLLARLFDEQLFIERRSRPSGASYQLHPLFRAFLLARAEKAMSVGDLAALHLRACEVLEESGDVESAAALALECANWTVLSKLIVNLGPPLAMQGRTATLGKWLEALPQDCCAANGWLIYWRGICRMLRDVALGLLDLEEAYAWFRNRDDVTGAFLSLGGIFESYFFAWGDFRPLDRWIVELEKLLAACGGSIPAQIEVQMLGKFQALMLRAPDHRVALHITERALAIAEQVADPLPRSTLGCVAIAGLAWRGDEVRALEVVELIRSTPHMDEVPGFVAQNVANWRALVLGYRGEFVQARAIFLQAIDESRKTGLTVVEPHTWKHLALCELKASNPEEAGFAISEGLKLLPHVIPHRQDFRVLKSVQLVLAGRHAEAMAVAGDLVGQDLGNGVPHNAALERILLALVYLEAGALAQAATLLEAARASAHHVRGKKLLFDISLLSAALTFLRDGSGANPAELAQALQIGASCSFCTGVSLIIPKIASRVLGIALNRGIEQGYVRWLIRRRKLEPPTDVDLDIIWPSRLRIHTLGGFHILVDDLPLLLRSRTPRKPLEVLQALVALGPRDVSLSVLTSRLWNDLEGDAAHNACHVAIHRLRRILGDEDMIFVDQGRVRLRADGTWTDVSAFQRVADSVDQILAASERPAPGKLLAMSRELLKAYPGHFLPESDAGWAVRAREQLRSRFQRSASVLAGALQGAGLLDASVEINRHGIELDPLAEVFHRGIIQALVGQDRNAEALDAYRRCREILCATLGVEPSPQTRALHKMIVEGRHQ